MFHAQFETSARPLTSHRDRGGATHKPAQLGGDGPRHSVLCRTSGPRV
jgi:hypothetical protein